MNEPQISVIINTYNSEKFLAETLASLRSQTVTDWEAIVWDNGSVDSTRDIVMSFQDERIRFFQDCEKVSLYQSRINGLQESTGQLVAFLDHDDAWLPSKLELQSRVFQDERVACSSSDAVIISTDGSLTDEIKSGKIARTYSNTRIDREQLTRHYRVGMSTLMARRSAVFRCLPNPVPNYTIIEDFDLVFRLLEYGTLIPLHEPLTLYRLHANNFSSKTDIYLNEIQQWLADFGSSGESSPETDSIALNVWNSYLRTAARRELQSGSRIQAVRLASEMVWGSDRLKLLAGSLALPRSILKKL